MKDFPNSETEFRLNWTAQGSKVAVLGEMIGLLNGKAAEAFTRKRDEAANSLRNIADEIGHRHKKESELLQEYIAEDQRRDLEFRQKMKAPRPKLEIGRGGRG